MCLPQVQNRTVLFWYKTLGHVLVTGAELSRNGQSRKDLRPSKLNMLLLYSWIMVAGSLAELLACVSAALSLASVWLKASRPSQGCWLGAVATGGLLCVFWLPPVLRQVQYYTPEYNII